MSILGFFIQALLIFLVVFFLIFTCYEINSSGLRRKNKVSNVLDKANFSSNLKKNKNNQIRNQEITSKNFSTKDLKEKIDYKKNIICSILLPICNEVDVVDNLLSSVYKILVPANVEIEIILLDDSNLSNSLIIKKKYDEFLKNHNATELDISNTNDAYSYKSFEYSQSEERGSNHLKKLIYLKRDDKEKTGFKAGNLNYGIQFAHGDFFIIFDADCIPPTNFLEQTLPLFEDSKIGFIQTAISFRNKEHNFITKFLALETSHKDDITSSSNSNVDDLTDTNQNSQSNGYQDFASLTGSSCIWRKSCLNDIGGISSETLTEDIDLCYRAQLKGWKYKYVESVVSSEELPNTISGLRVQRHRWAYGLIRNAFLYTSKVLLDKDFSISKRFKAFMLISQTFLLASFIVLLILSLPLVFVTEELGLVFNVSCSLFLLTTVIWAYNNITTGQNHSESSIENKCSNIENIEFKKKKKINWLISFFEYIGYVLLYLPLSLYYFVALLENIFGIKTSFIPTRKEGMFVNDSNYDKSSPLVENYEYINKIKKVTQNTKTIQAKSKDYVSKSRINLALIALEMMSFFYSLSVVVLSIYYQNYWTLLYSLICLCGFGLALSLAAKEYYHNKKRCNENE